MKSGFITHKEKPIFLCDYSNFGSNNTALKAEIADADAAIVKHPENSLLVLLDARNSVASTDVIQYLKEVSGRTKRHIKKMAIVGVTGVRKIFLQSITRLSGQQATLFEDMESAKNWLVSSADPERGGPTEEPGKTGE
jgi:hypothetical protein